MTQSILLNWHKIMVIDQDGVYWKAFLKHAREGGYISEGKRVGILSTKRIYLKTFTLTFIHLKTIYRQKTK